MTLHEQTPDWIIHIARPAQVGGTITSTMRQAELQHRACMSVELWSMVQSQKEKVRELAGRSVTPFHQTGSVSLLMKCVMLRFRRGHGIVHVHSGRSDITDKQTLLRRLLPRSVPLVVTVHGPSQSEKRLSDPQWRSDHLANSEKIDMIGVPSEYERQVQINLGLPSEKVFVIPDVITAKAGRAGVLRGQLHLGATERIILFCGRVVREKGTRLLIRAFANIAGEFSNCTLVIAGKGVNMERCREEAKPLGDRVRFLGHVSSVDDLYADADIFAAPSTGESFGISAMEAALSQVPMLLTEIPPWTDIFNSGESCEFVPVDDVERISAALRSMLADPARAKHLAENAYKIVIDRFTPDRVLEALDTFYASGIRRHNENRRSHT